MSEPRASYGGASPDDLSRALRRLSRAIVRLEDGAIESAGLPRAQAHALLAVATMARPAMSMLARELDLAPSTVTRLLDPLVERGLVKRDSTPEDRRVVVLDLTGAGRQMVKRLTTNLEGTYARVAAAAAESGGRRRLIAAAKELAAVFERVRA
jgi:DNA-binding MarR family transcriptional regulator